MTNESRSMPPLITNIRQALKQNLVPGICLQLFALALALAYFKWPAATAVMDVFAGLKVQYGWVYSMCSTAIFGGLIPFCYLWLSGHIKRGIVPLALFYVLFWAYKGVEVDLLYTAQSIWFGTGNDWPTLIKKTAIDQFIYGTFWAAPTMAVGSRPRPFPSRCWSIPPMPSGSIIWPRPRLWPPPPE